MGTTHQVVIDVISKQDFAQEEFGQHLWNILAVDKISPEFVGHAEPVNHPVSSVEDWLVHWAPKASIRVHNVSREFREGLLWRRRHASQGWGSIKFARGPAREFRLHFESSWNTKVAWQSTFDSMVELFSPEYARLHLLQKPKRGEPRGTESFDILGIRQLVSWETSLGQVRTPDSWEKEKWTEYIYLPQLSWRNFLGNGFYDQVDIDSIRRQSRDVVETDSGLSFSITEALSDAIEFPERFSEQRARIRSSFSPGFFDHRKDR